MVDLGYCIYTSQLNPSTVEVSGFVIKVGVNF